MIAIKDPVVSIVIPTHNRWEKLHKTLLHLKDIRDPLIDLVIVDNASDENPEFRIRKIFPQARVVRLRKNIGAAARNVGINLARSKYILMLDDDSYPRPDALTRMIRLFESNPLYGVISFKVFLSDGTLESTGCHNVFLGCAAAFRKEVFEQAGGYPPEYHYYVEEYDLSYRIIDKGYKIVYSEDCVAYHNRDLRRRLDRIVYYLIRNNMILWAKYFPVDVMLAKMRESFDRYRAIAKKEGVSSSFYLGFASGLWQAARTFLFNRRVLSRWTVNEVLQTNYLRSKFREKGLHPAARSKVGLVCVGKIFSSFLEVCEELKLDITGIYDPDYQYLNRYRPVYKGIAVSPIDRIGQDRPEVLILCTSDISLQKRLTADLFQKYPFCKIHSFYGDREATLVS